MILSEVEKEQERLLLKEAIQLLLEMDCWFNDGDDCLWCDGDDYGHEEKCALSIFLKKVGVR